MRGLKYTDLEKQAEIVKVAPYTGAWIEISGIIKATSGAMVAPYTGAWIEIKNLLTVGFISTVAPYTGAWIEIVSIYLNIASFRRTLHGCVD